MARIALSFLGIIILAATLPAQSGQAPVQPAPSGEKSTVPAAVYHPSLATATNAIPACPANWEPHPEIDGVYKVGGDVKPPRLVSYQDPDFTPEYRNWMNEHHLNAHSVSSSLGFVVDLQGHAQDICIDRAAGFGLDLNALLTLRKAKFKPGTLNKTPVAVRLSMEINFHLY